MQFGLSEEQRLLQSSLHRMLEADAGLESVRDAAAGSNAPATTLYDRLTELGVTGVLVPHNFGGLGLGMLDAAVTAEALGAFVAPVAFVAPLVMAPVATRLGASPAQQEQWLPGIVAGELRFAVGLSERIGARDSARVRFENGRLYGETLFTLDTEDATDYLVADRHGVLHRVAGDDRAVEETRLTTVDRTRSLGILTLEGASAETLPGSTDTTVISRTIDAGRIALAADTLGAAQTMVERAVAYAKERKQFDRVIGSFQAVKHMCAEMAAELEPCRALVWHAAHAYDAIPDEGPLLACHVKAHLAEVGQRVARTATEVHGGMGFTDLLGLHYWFKRIGLNRQALGGPERVREEAARLQGWVGV